MRTFVGSVLEAAGDYVVDEVGDGFDALRLVGAEMLALPDTPRAVIVAEAVRLASRYGSERSAPFVNGVAEALAKRLRPGSK